MGRRGPARNNRQKQGEPWVRGRWARPAATEPAHRREAPLPGAFSEPGGCQPVTAHHSPTVRTRREVPPIHSLGAASGGEGAKVTPNSRLARPLRPAGLESAALPVTCRAKHSTGYRPQRALLRPATWTLTFSRPEAPLQPPWACPPPSPLQAGPTEPRTHPHNVPTSPVAGAQAGDSRVPGPIAVKGDASAAGSDLRSVGRCSNAEPTATACFQSPATTRITRCPRCGFGGRKTGRKARKSLFPGGPAWGPLGRNASRRALWGCRGQLGGGRGGGGAVGGAWVFPRHQRVPCSNPGPSRESLPGLAASPAAFVQGQLLTSPHPPSPSTPRGLALTALLSTRKGSLRKIVCAQPLALSPPHAGRAPGRSLRARRQERCPRPGPGLQSRLTPPEKRSMKKRSPSPENRLVFRLRPLLGLLFTTNKTPAPPRWARAVRWLNIHP